MLQCQAAAEGSHPLQIRLPGSSPHALRENRPSAPPASAPMLLAVLKLSRSPASARDKEGMRFFEDSLPLINSAVALLVRGLAQVARDVA